MSATATWSKKCVAAATNFGGEQSGHLIFLDHATTGDGTVAALQVIAIMLQESRPLSELSQADAARPTSARKA